MSEAQDVIDYAEVLRRIPHRYPFLLIDRARDFVPGETITGIKCVSINEPFFQGHFPGDPVMPGVLIVEALAQCASVLISKTLDIDVTRKTVMLASVDNARFRSPARPGDVLMLKTDVQRARGDLFKFKGTVTIDGASCAEAEFAAMVVEKR